MNYGEVALGVECALPPSFGAGRRRRRPLLVLWLVLALVTAAIL